MASLPQTEASELRSVEVPVTSPSCGVFKRILRFWTSLQVSYYGGKYSIERALALDEYTRTTSLSRVLLVCCGTPLPMMILVAIQELLPLQDPTSGWYENYGFWIRLTMLSAVTANTFLIQGTFMVEGFKLSWWQLVFFIVMLSSIHTAAGMVVSATIFFPIPFFYITMTPSFYVPLFSLLYVMLGKSSVNYISYIAIQKIMGMVYPAYQLLFHKAAATYYVLPVVLLQPVIKIAAKNVILRFTKHLEDLTPEAVIFTVDFYNALYLVTFMESASTLNTMLILIGTDVSQTILVLLKVHRRTATVLQRLHLVAGAFADENLLAAVCLLCRNQDELATQINENVRVRSCLAHRLSPADNNLLFMLEKSAANAPHPAQCWPTVVRPLSSNFKPVQSPNSPLKKLQRLLRRHAGTVRPTGSLIKRSLCLQPSVLSVSRHESRILSRTRVRYSNILRETLEVLYTTECLVLTAYLEAFIPIFYCMYMLLMVHFPNAQYHTELKNVTRQNVNYTVTVVAFFGLLQVVSFGLLAVLIRQKCGMNVLYQLAFVLETQMALVQGKLMIWVLVTLACRVVHFGVDFSFRFSWVNNVA